jgi:hypothetical protein
MSRSRTVVLIAAFAVAALFAAPAATAKSYHLSKAVETFRVQRDGSVLATEELTFDFSGSFHGAYRLIPAAPGESIDHVQVSGGGVPYSPGADARVGSSGAVESYGVMMTDTGWTQIAWHFAARDSVRTFVVSYRMHRFVRAYRDVGNLYLQVWGDQWPVRLDRLHADVIFPGPATKADRARELLRVWGHPATVRGSVAIAGPDRVTIDATDIPAWQFVEIDTTFPRHLLAARGSFVARPGAGLALVVARERSIYSSPYGRSPSPVAKPSGGGGIIGFLKGLGVFLLLPLTLISRLFGFGHGGAAGRSGAVGGFGGSLGGFGGGGVGGAGGGGGGGGGGAW